MESKGCNDDQNNRQKHNNQKAMKEKLTQNNNQMTMKDVMIQTMIMDKCICFQMMNPMKLKMNLKKTQSKLNNTTANEISSPSDRRLKLQRLLLGERTALALPSVVWHGKQHAGQSNSMLYQIIARIEKTSAQEKGEVNEALW